MFTVLIVLHVLLAAGLIVIVLLQRGPGATMGAAFGAGASGTVFGSRGAGSFLTRTTGWMAAGFFGISLTMAVLAARDTGPVQNDLGLVGSMVEQQAQMLEEQDNAATVDALIETLDGENGLLVEDDTLEPPVDAVEAAEDVQPESTPEPPTDG
ncbi:MAG: preprotein translocase subunit SecG [Pseudomonadota bacterium]